MPAAMVCERVMLPAQMREVLGACYSAVCSGDRMVEIAAMQGSAAAWEPTVQVARRAVDAFARLGGNDQR